MIDARLARKITDAIDAGFDRQIAFTQDLVRFPSQRGQEHTAQDFMHQAMRGRGLSVDRFAIDVDAIRHHPGFSPVTVSYDNMLNVVGTHRPRTVKGRSLILNGHIDVVPVGPADMWTHPPYEPLIDGDWMYGRGAGDMKAGLAATLFAFDALAVAGVQPAATVYFQSVTEEECTGNGALACFLRGYRADAVLIPEPAQNRLVRANAGVLWFQVEVRGRPVHVHAATTGANAIVAIYGVIEALKKLEAEWNARKSDFRHFEAMDHPININVGKIAGGDWASSVPAWCRIDVRAGIYPGVKVDDAKREIEQAIAAAARDDPFLSNNPPEITYNGFTVEGYTLEDGSDAEAALREAHRAVFNASLDDIVLPAYLDARVFALYDETPALVYGPYAESIHAFDERVDLTAVRQVTKTIALFMAEWCGVEDVERSG